MNVDRILDGLWRWSSPHPSWTPEADRPDGWARDVGSVYYESASGVVLIDPLVPRDPPDAERFWRALDADVSRVGGAVTVLLGCVDHGRSVDAVRERYVSAGRKVAVIGAAAIRETVSCRLTDTLEASPLPAGIEARAIVGLSPGETAYFLSAPRALVFADAVIGAGQGRVRLAPASWGVRTPSGREVYDRGFRASLEPLLALAPEILLASHGAPVLSNGAAALREALSAPAWGE